MGESKLKIGNRVQHVSGGPIMGVSEVADDQVKYKLHQLEGKVRCTWFVDGVNKQSDWFHVDELKLVEDTSN